MLKRGITCTEFDVDRASMESQLFSIGHSATINDPEENWYIYHSDHLGSSAFLTNASGDPTQHLQYMPYGENFIEQHSITSYYTPYTFSAKERDPETGYSYFGARYYYSDISVWLSVDPMGGKYPGFSSYCYVLNNPIRYRDAHGLEPEEFGGGLRSFFRKAKSWVKGDGWQDPYDWFCKRDSEGNLTNEPKIVKFRNPVIITASARTENILFSNANMHKTVSEYTLKILSEILHESNNESALITSTIRTPEDQVRIMFNNIKTYGVEHQKRLYSYNGDKVIEQYPNKDLMLEKINEIGSQNISRFCGDFNKINVIDISPGSIKNKTEFIQQIKRNPNIDKFIYPPKDPAIHIEIIQN
jgi:RHS repeat-associated protein